MLGALSILGVNMDTTIHKCKECGFEFHYSGKKINYCPGCGALTSEWREIFKDLLQLADVDKKLSDSISLFNKNAYLDAARTALILLESELKNKGNTDKFGYPLVNEVLGFEYDNSNNEFTREPKIKINDLGSNLERNEQKGIEQLVHGLFRGLRNILMHKQVDLSPINGLTIIVLCNMIIDIINNGSIDKTRYCEWKLINPKNST